MNTADPMPDPTEVFRALADPVRWSIVMQIGAADELPCSVLEDTLPIAKPTISYHTRLLQQAGLIAVRKEGRRYFYTLRRAAIDAVMDQLWELAPRPVPVVGNEASYARANTRRRATVGGSRAGLPTVDAMAAGDGGQVVVLTW